MLYACIISVANGPARNIGEHLLHKNKKSINDNNISVRIFDKIYISYLLKSVDVYSAIDVTYCTNFERPGGGSVGVSRCVRPKYCYKRSIVDQR